MFYETSVSFAGLSSKLIPSPLPSGAYASYATGSICDLNEKIKYIEIFKNDSIKLNNSITYIKLFKLRVSE